MENPETGAPVDSPSTPVDSSTFLESLSDKEREDFFNGSAESRKERASKPDAPKKAAKAAAQPLADDADAAPAKPVEQAASTDVDDPPVSEAGKAAKPTKGLDARSADVDLKIADLKRKLEIKQELERQLSTRPHDAKPAEPSPASEKKPWEVYKDLPDAPKPTDFENYEDYLDARSDFIAEQKIKAFRATEQQSTEQHQQTLELETRATQSRERGTKFWDAHPELKAEVHPLILDIIPTRLYAQMSPEERAAGGRPHPFGDLLWESPLASEVTVYLSRNPQEFQALLAAKTPKDLLLGFGRIEARVEKMFDPESGAVERTTPQPKTVPDADELPVTLGKRPAVTAEVSTTSTDFKGDFAAYERRWRAEHGIKD